MNRLPRVAALACLALLQACALNVARSAHDGNTSHVRSFLRESRDRAGARFSERIGNVDCPDCTLLHFAVLGGSKEVAELLISSGADPNATDRNGETPLYLTCITQDIEMARYLLAHGAQRSLSMHSATGHTPLLMANAIVGVRRTAVPMVGGGWAFRDEPALPSVEIVRVLLDAGAEVSGPGRGGNTALHLAAFRGHTDMVRLLLSRGADRTSRNSRGETPEALAERARRDDVVKLLRDAAAR